MSPLRLTLAVAAVALMTGLPAPAVAQPAQTAFASPEDAAKALIDTVKARNLNALLAMFGPAGEPLLTSGDPVEDADTRDHFVSEYDAAHRFDANGDSATLIIGKDDWPFPIPLKKEGDQWRFDTAAGQQEILNRRIGGNELATIQTLLAVVDAQEDYAELQAGEGPAVFAQRFLSTPGRHDGLYWPVKEGEKESPLGSLIADARGEGYRAAANGARTPYHGYFFKILTGQGPDAPGGAADYIVNGKMIGGFAAIAWPARYGDSGVMTFLVNYQGQAYQSDLGPNTATLAGAITRFDPDSTWRKVEP